MKRFAPDVPFDQLPLLPPKTDLNAPELLKAAIHANRELASLRMATRLIPNQAVLINSIPLLESQASSAIENIVTTTDELFQQANSPPEMQTSAVKETLYYRSALKRGFELIRERPLTIHTACEICSIIRQTDMNIRKQPGTTLVNDATGEKIYTPPSGESRIRDLLTNWQQFIHQEDEIDPLIKMAVQHYQFEAIHPFTDGNGRTGRVLNLLYLVEQGLIDSPVLYLSRYIIRHKGDYYRKLINVTAKEDWFEWILYFLIGVKETAQWTTNKILAIEYLIKDVQEVIRRELKASYRDQLIELLFTQPYIRIQTIVDNGLTVRQTASKHLKHLVDLNILEEVKVGRDKVFINVKFLDLLKSN